MWITVCYDCAWTSGKLAHRETAAKFGWVHQAHRPGHIVLTKRTADRLAGRLATHTATLSAHSRITLRLREDAALFLRSLRDPHSRHAAQADIWAVVTSSEHRTAHPPR